MRRFRQLRNLRKTFDKHDLKAIEKMGYQIGKPLGKGSFGIVFSGKFHDRLCAVKLQSYDSASLWLAEIVYLKTLHHSHIIEFFGTYLTIREQLLIFMELADGGTLEDLIDSKIECRKKELSRIVSGYDAECEGARFYCQIGDALRYCHRNGVAHRDIKPANILLDERQTICKLSDFGLAVLLYRPQTGEANYLLSHRGTRGYIPIEFYRSSSSSLRYDDRKADVWATGLTLYQLFNGMRMLSLDKIDEEIDSSAKKGIKLIAISLDWFNGSLSRDAKRFVLRHFILDFESRPTFEELLQDPFLEKAYSFVPALKKNNNNR